MATRAEGDNKEAEISSEIRIIESNLQEHGLVKVDCTCGRHFYTSNRSNCFCPSCVGMPKLLEEPNIMVEESGELSDHLRNFFQTRGYSNQQALRIDNTIGQTSFVVAAVQALEKPLFHGTAFPASPIFVLQPSIRTTDIGLIESGGFLNSFINVSTLKYKATLNDYSKAITDWLEFFKSEFPDRLLKVEYRSKEDDWGMGQFQGSIVDIYLDDIPVGDLIFWRNFPSKEGRVNFIDCGFGYERLLWAKNGGEFRSVVFGINICPDIATLDAIRTTVLVMMSGVNAYENKDRIRVQKLRQFIGEINNRFKGKYDQLESLTRDMFEYWEKYMEAMWPINANYLYWKLRGYLKEEGGLIE